MIFSNFNFLDRSANCRILSRFADRGKTADSCFFADPFPQAGDRGRQGLHGVKSPFSAKSDCPLRCRQTRPETPCLSLPSAGPAAPLPPAVSQCPADDIAGAPPCDRCVPGARQDRAHDLPVFFCNEAGIGIAPQKARNAVLGVIQIVQSHTLTGTPQFINRSIIVQMHIPNVHGCPLAKSLYESKKPAAPIALRGF